MKTIGAIAWGSLWVACMLFSVQVATRLYDRFTEEVTASSFYSHRTDMTCVVTTGFGYQSLFCVEGDRMKELGDEPTAP